MPMDSPSGMKPWQQAQIDSANDEEHYVVFGGNVEALSKKYVNELKSVASDPGQRQRDRQAALDKLQRFSERGSKFAKAALGELGFGSRAMSPEIFERAVNNMRLDPKRKRQVEAMGPGFFRFASDLASADTAEARFQLNDLIQRSGPEAAARFVEAAQDSEIAAINTAFVEANPTYYRSDKNYQTLVDFIALQYLHTDTSQVEGTELMQNLLADGHWNVENLTEAFNILSAEGLIEVRPGQARPLTADDRQALSLACAAMRTDADLDRVLNAYLQFALGENAPRSWRDAITDSRQSSVLFEAVLFAWSHRRADYLPSEGAEEYLRKYLAGRFPTFPLLDAAWERCKKETDGHGLVSEMESMVSDAQAHQDDELERINRRYSVQ